MDFQTYYLVNIYVFTCAEFFESFLDVRWKHPTIKFCFGIKEYISIILDDLRMMMMMITL